MKKVYEIFKENVTYVEYGRSGKSISIWKPYI